MKYVALLRGVNVGGVNMKMAELAKVVRDLGYENVSTVLASGNLLFETQDASAAAKKKLETALRAAFGYEAWVHVLTVAQVKKIVDAYPYPRSAERHAYVVFVEKDSVRDELLAVELDPNVEKAEKGNGVVYWTVPKGDTLGSAMGKAQSASKHKPWLTTRNLNTLEKLTK